MSTPTKRPPEGFVRAVDPPEEPLEPEAQAPDSAPQSPLSPRLKTVPPEIEPPLSDADQARKLISEFGTKWPVTIELLYKPIMNDKGELVNSLTFREPRASDINRVGNPVRLNADGEFIIEERKMTYIIGALTGILPPLLEAMSPRDWHAIALWLREFFLPDFRGMPKRQSTTE
jgi:hypothetical protein